MKIILLAGGNSRRLSHIINIPKQFYILKNGLSSFMVAIQRALLNSKNLIIIINQDYLDLAQSQAQKIALNFYHNFIFIIEPLINNNLSAIFLSLLYLENLGLISKKEKILLKPCDHIITDLENYQATINYAHHSEEGLLLFGIKSKEINENYGHIIYCPNNYSLLKKIKTFIEKPDKNIIKKLNDYVWNSGLIYGAINLILKILSHYLIKNYNFLIKNLIKVNLSLDKKIFLDKIDYIGLPNISVDYAILSFIKLAKVYIVDFDWLDIGSPDHFIPMAF